MPTAASLRLGLVGQGDDLTGAKFRHSGSLEEETIG